MTKPQPHHATCAARASVPPLLALATALARLQGDDNYTHQRLTLASRSRRERDDPPPAPRFQMRCTQSAIGGAACGSAVGACAGCCAVALCISISIALLSGLEDGGALHDRQHPPVRSPAALAAARPRRLLPAPDLAGVRSATRRRLDRLCFSIGFASQ